ncbi:MAG: hypothetical protein ACXAEU_24220 [Candidatus Hodarchaeales archaeon]|jgi:hypothetical protein
MFLAKGKSKVFERTILAVIITFCFIFSTNGGFYHPITISTDPEQLTRLSSSNNTPPVVANISFIIEHGADVVFPVNSSREFLLEDEMLSMEYDYFDVDGDPDESTIHWFRDGERQDQFTNLTVVPATATSPGDAWWVNITPHDGFEAGSPVVSTNMTIESRPDILDFSVEPQETEEGHYNLWVRVVDERNAIELVEFNITITELNASLVFSDLRLVNDSVWVLEDFKILDVLADLGHNIQEFASLISTDTIVEVTAKTKVIYSDLEYFITRQKVLNFTIEDNAPPRIVDAYFIFDHSWTPTYLTFYALIQEYGSGIDEVVLFYDINITREVTNDNISMQFNGTHYYVMVPVNINPCSSEIQIQYTIQVTDRTLNKNNYSHDFYMRPFSCTDDPPPPLPIFLLIFFMLAVFVIVLLMIVRRKMRIEEK